MGKLRSEVVVWENIPGFGILFGIPGGPLRWSKEMVRERFSASELGRKYELHLMGRLVAQLQET